MDNDDENKDDENRENYKKYERYYEGEDIKNLWKLWHELLFEKDKKVEDRHFWALWDFTKMVMDQFINLDSKIVELKKMLEERDLELFYNNWYEFNPDWIEEMS
jgi:hypothetical protein